MLKRINVALFTAMVVFGAAASTSTRVYGFDDARCGGDVKPLCRTRAVEKCVEWYPCGLWQRCCKTWDKSTTHDYFRGDGGGDWLPEPE
jgi:hypothetical protein